MSESAALRLRRLALPDTLDDLSGLVQADLNAIVDMLTERATEQLLLTHRQRTSLRGELWNRLVDSLNDAVAPLNVESR